MQEIFTNDALESRQNRSWDLLYFLDMREFLQLTPNCDKAEKVINAFDKYVTPKIPGFRRSIIHGDVNGLNIILKNMLLNDEKRYHFKSFIDFGDCSKTCRVFELAHFCKESLAYGG